MKNKSLLYRLAPAALLLALLPVTVPAAAEPSARKPSKETLAKYDVDRDGVLSEAESAKARADAAAKGRETRRKNLEQYDADGDGRLSETEKAKRQADEAAARDAKKAAREAKRAQP